MNRFGLPLVPSMLALWLLNFGDRFFLLKLTDASEVGVYSIGARIASAMVLLLTAFRAAGLHSRTRSRTTTRPSARTRSC